jgi:hypothetical protein
MNDLSHIRRRGANEEFRIASARRGICHCSSALLNGERGAEDISGPGGRRKSLKRLNPDKEIQGKPSLFLGLSLRGLGPVWLNLDSAWIGLGRSHRPIHQAEIGSPPNGQLAARKATKLPTPGADGPRHGGGARIGEERGFRLGLARKPLNNLESRKIKACISLPPALDFPSSGFGFSFPWL